MPVEEEPRRHSGLTQEPLHTAVSRRLELTGAMHDTVEVLTEIEDPHDELPDRGVILRLELANGEVGPQRLAIIRLWYLELSRNRAFGHTRISLWRETPAEYSPREDAEVRQIRE
jgi:hypothetical protein